MYGWNESTLKSFMSFIEQAGFIDVDLYRAFRYTP